MILSYSSLFESSSALSSLQSLVKPTTLLLCLTFTYNIYTASRPLYRPKDDITDIALTPTQRSLLGLDPSMVAPPTPGTTYITPPRYPRSPGSPLSSSSASPFGSGSSLGRSRNRDSLEGGTQYNTPSSSPLWQKSRAAAAIRRRNSGHGTPSPLGPSAGNDRSVLGVSSGSTTASPLSGRGGAGASVGLNSKWLYERGRSSSSGGLRGLYT